MQIICSGTDLLVLHVMSLPSLFAARSSRRLSQPRPGLIAAAMAASHALRSSAVHGLGKATKMPSVASRPRSGRPRAARVVRHRHRRRHRPSAEVRPSSRLPGALRICGQRLEALAMGTGNSLQGAHSPSGPISPVPASRRMVTGAVLTLPIGTQSIRARARIR